MKKLLSIVLVISILACLFTGLNFSVSADTEGEYTYNVSNDEATITKVDSSIAGDVTIPSTLSGYPVTSIYDSAFENCTEITSITIPDSITDIGIYSFVGCTRLTSITVKSGNKKYHSAGNCLIETKSKRLVLGCKKSVIPTDGSVTSIGEYAFFKYTGLTSITIPNSITSIGDSAFDGCTGLTSIIIPNSVTDIDSYSFGGCTGITSITVKSGNKKYHSAGNCLIETKSKKLVLGCKKSIIPTDGSVTSIGECAFRGCTGLTSITIPNCVTSIDECAFDGCKGLTSITIPNSVTIIKTYTLSECTGLTSITISKSVAIIGECAFDGCKKLKTVYYTGTKSQKNKISIQEQNESLNNATWKYAASISLSTTKYIYNGKTKTPTVTVKDAAGKKLTKNKDYTVSYAKGRKYVGKYAVKITLKNGYYNNSPTRYITINPKGTSVSSLTKPKTKQIKVTWKKQTTQTTGYQIQYSTSKTFKIENKIATIKSNKTTSKTLTGLAKNKTYYVRIRTYKTVGKTKYYSAWSKAKSVKTK